SVRPSAQWSCARPRPRRRARACAFSGPSCLLELSRHHLAETLEAADLDLGVAVELFLQELILLFVVTGIKILACVAQTVERRHGEIEVTVLNQLRGLPVKEGNQ